DDIPARIIVDQQPNIRHEPIDVPDNASPFSSQEAENIFWQALQEVRESGSIPEDMGLDLEGYPTEEELSVARRRIVIPLPLNPWYERAVYWCQALDVMYGLL
ncbi:hypothetical protein OF83DRAFT_1037373, partial [Amylostereum chailletii]